MVCDVSTYMRSNWDVATTSHAGWNHTLQYTEAVTQKCSAKNVFLKISQNLQKNNHCWSLFLWKLQASVLQFFWKKRLRHTSFPVNFAKYSRTPSFIEHPRWMLLSIQFCLGVLLQLEMFLKNASEIWTKLICYSNIYKKHLRRSTLQQKLKVESLR